MLKQRKNAEKENILSLLQNQNQNGYLNLEFLKAFENKCFFLKNETLQNEYDWKRNEEIKNLLKALNKNMFKR